MKHSIGVKFMMILLTACSLVAAIGGAVGIVAMESKGLYVNGLELLQDQEYSSIADSVATDFADYYAVKNLSNLSYASREGRYSNPENRGDADHWTVKLRQGEQILVDPGNTSGYSLKFEYRMAPVYPIVSVWGPDDIPPESTEPSQETEAIRSSSAYEGVTVPEGYLYHEAETVWEGGSFTTYHYYYSEAPEYTVTVYMSPEVLESSALHILTTMYPHRYAFIAVLAVGLLLFSVGIVYLVWSAGWAPDGQLRPAGLNRLPLDLYAFVAGGGILGLTSLLFYLIDWMEYEGPHMGNLSLIGVNLLMLTLLTIGFLTAFSAQVKIRGFWWSHSVLGWCWRKIRGGVSLLWQGVQKLLGLLPVIWQWLLTAFLMAFSVVVLLLLSWNGNDFFEILLLADILLCVGIVLYGGYAFGTLMKGIRRMSEGELSYQIPTRYLTGSFLDFARQLNTLSETAMVAAQNQMKSERMKTELITNVSHDIKTPLTSIINFVDLLQKPHTQEESEQYLEVLSRQSGRMKKLIEDLVELSKANSGSISVDIVTMDAEETVNQALGEFADKLASVDLVPVFNHPEQPIRMAADGKLVWRVLSNTMSNAVKYAMPGTRLYIDLMRIEDQVMLSLKNVSREPLNISAEELMERFVRGDAARNSEGSGLGLNIAKSLMEVQHGDLQLLLDGDLFKVVLIFPAA